MDATPRTVIVVAGGDPIDGAVLHRLPAGATVVAADSGLDRAAVLGLTADVVVGDFDSVDPEHLRAVEEQGASVERHPPEKDAIDLELGLDAAVRLGANRIVVIGGHGGRLDMAWATGLLLASPRYSAMGIEAFVGRAHVLVVRGGTGWVSVEAEPGAVLSLLPAHGPAFGVRTRGLRYPLGGEDLPAGSTRGISNVVLTSPSGIALEKGTILCVLP